MSSSHPDIDARARRLAEKQGAAWWRSLEELSQEPDFDAYVAERFGPRAASWLEPTETVGRRGFLQLMGASMALAGLGSCTRQPEERILPYARTPEETVPGEPLFFATAMPLGGAATGLLVESHGGRPTKIEGNPEHPSSLGATDALAQASILSLYDPGRSQVVKQAGRIDSWDGFLTALAPVLEGQAAKQGTGVRIVSETLDSPTLVAQRKALLEKLPNAEWIELDAVSRDNVVQGCRLAFGRDLKPHYDLALADVIVSLESDLLASGPGHVAYARQFARRRKPGLDGERSGMNRLYAAESTPTVTGAAADHRFILRPGELEDLAACLAGKLGVIPETTADPAFAAWLEPVLEDLLAKPGRSLVVCGDDQPPRVHALCFAINEALRNVEKTVFYVESPDAPVDARKLASQAEQFSRLCAQMAGGEIELLVILGGNPVYHAAASTGFAERLLDVPFSVHLSLYEDETSRSCRWHVPEAHFLEAWSDTVAHDGTASVVQPLIAPLYGGKSAHELVAALSGEAAVGGYELVRATWEARARGRNFEKWWRRALHDGVLEGTRPATLSPYLREDSASLLARGELRPGGMDILFRADPAVYDGRFAANGWLQELPRPLTKLCWGNAALVSPLTAERLDVKNGDLLRISVGEVQVEVPTWILPGQAVDCVTLHLGYGRRQGAQAGIGVGVDVYPLKPAGRAHAVGVVEKAGGREELATTQAHHSMEGRDLIRVRDVASLGHDHEGDEHASGHGAHGDLSIYPEHPPADHAWGMVIDLTSCIGCNACVVGCQSENNIPIVGKDEVRNGREMHWMRIDRYWQGLPDDPDTHYQPVTCMHCETAPCEVVCPVGATTHSPEGLNEMTYNRCVGTRYCSNNCPYKVRRFNFYRYSDTESESLKLGRNPDVTVRTRGVMEKCTYCVQRINQARITARREGRSIRDGEIVTACQSVCPSEAITFGDLQDPASEVSKRAANPLNYGLLTELNTKPRTTYLAKVKNPNPTLAALEPVHEGGHGEEAHDGGH